MGCDSIVSERALREIYLRGFEIAVKTAQPMAIVTSYNLINGVHTANSKGSVHRGGEGGMEFPGDYHDGLDDDDAPGRQQRLGMYSGGERSDYAGL